MLKKIVLFETKENVANISTCLGHGNEQCQQELLTFLGEHALSSLDSLHIDEPFDNIELKSLYRLKPLDINLTTSMSMIFL